MISWGSSFIYFSRSISHFASIVDLLLQTFYILALGAFHLKFTYYLEVFGAYLLILEYLSLVQLFLQVYFLWTHFKFQMQIVSLPVIFHLDVHALEVTFPSLSIYLLSSLFIWHWSYYFNSCEGSLLLISLFIYLLCIFGCLYMLVIISFTCQSIYMFQIDEWCISWLTNLSSPRTCLVSLTKP